MLIDYVSRTGKNIVHNVPFVLAICLDDTLKVISGLGATALSLLTLGLIPEINAFANQTQNGKNILSNPYFCAVTIINPDAQPGKRRISIITSYIATPIFTKALEYARNNESFLHKHIFSRGAFALGAIVATVTRIADFILGLIAAVISIVPLFGRIDRINHFAIDNLAALGSLIHDVCSSLRGIVNPQQFILKIK